VNEVVLIAYHIYFCRIRGSHSSGYIKSYILGYNAVWSSESQLKALFRATLVIPVFPAVGSLGCVGEPMRNGKLFLHSYWPSPAQYLVSGPTGTHDHFFFVPRPCVWKWGLLFDDRSDPEVLNGIKHAYTQMILFYCLICLKLTQPYMNGFYSNMTQCNQWYAENINTRILFVTGHQIPGAAIPFEK
jgi:hypothetical protein